MIPCLDTNVFLDMRGKSGKRMQQVAQATVLELFRKFGAPVTTRINVAELYVGVQLSDQPEAEYAAIQAALGSMEILEFDERAARQYGKIQAHLKKRGQLVGDLDTLIGSIALVNGHSVVTRNRRHFERIPGLNVVSYTTD